MTPLTGWPAPRTDRHATALLVDAPGCRLVAFTLAAGQSVPLHTSPATVMVTVLEGDGAFRGANGDVTLQAGESLKYEPNEPHGMVAGESGLRFLAVITPGPSAVS